MIVCFIIRSRKYQSGQLQNVAEWLAPPPIKNKIKINGLAAKLIKQVTQLNELAVCL